VETLLIGCDIGTQGTKAAIYRLDGSCVSESFEASVLLHPEPDAITQDPEEMLASVCRTIRSAMAKCGASPDTIAAIGIDAQMAGILGIGIDGIAVTPYDSWLDTRCSAYVKMMKKAAGDEIVKITGGQVTIAHGPKVLWWKNEQPQIYSRISKFVTPSAYVVMRLCGLNADHAFIDYTHLHFTSFADSLNSKWDKGLLAEFGVTEDKLPGIIKPDQIVGKLTDEMAKECGLKSGIPVAAGCGDSAASSLGAGITEIGEIYDVAGTASIFSYTTDRFTPDVENKTMMMMRSVIEGQWNALAYISGGGLCIKWYKGISGKDYEELDKAAAETEAGCNGLLFIPHFAGRTCPNVPEIKGTWLGMNWQHGNSEMYRSIMESIAYEYCMYLDALYSLDKTVSPIAVYGVGGGSRSKIFSQIKADVLGVPYVSLACCDTATFGSAVVAGCACGAYSSIKEAARLNRIESCTVFPNQSNSKIYETMSLKYRRTLEMLTEIYNNQ